MQIALPDIHEPVTLVLAQKDRLTDEKYFAFCQSNPDLRTERTAGGEIIILPPTGFESDHRNIDASSQLQLWAKKAGQGRASGPSAEFLLPDRSALSPDAAWTSNKKLAAVPAAQLKQFPKLVPDFVIEIMSPSDRLRTAQRKMQDWIENGVDLGWLIDGDNKTVYVYRKQGGTEKLTEINQIKGEGPVEGFTLDLTDIWLGV